MKSDTIQAMCLSIVIISNLGDGLFCALRCRWLLIANLISSLDSFSVSENMDSYTSAW